jgi:glycosyltransferase involved in cell wall biosynthesis
MKNKKVIFLGSTPPPCMGPTMATKIILNSKLKDEFELLHLDTSDHRHLNTLNRVDFQNIFLALKHYMVLIWMIITTWPSMVYVPISQTTVGYFRDSGFILISKLFKRKVICHLRGGDFWNWCRSLNVLIRCIVYKIHNCVDGQIVLGEKLKSLFINILPLKKIYVVPNGKNVEINQLERKQSEKIKILYLSNLNQKKGVLDVLGAISSVNQDYKNIEGIFAGNWRDKSTKIEFKKLLIENSSIPVNVIGPVYGQAKHDLLSSSDIFVFPPYQTEGHPWVIVEAMAAGLPIITTDQGAITESVIDGLNGFIVEKRSPRQIAEKIKYLIENPDIRKKMGEQSRRFYLENFTEEKMIERLSHAFNSVLSS